MPFLAIIRPFTYWTVVTAALFTFVIPGPAHACTTFSLQKGNELLVGKNYDFLIGDCLVFVNKRGVAKTGITGPVASFPLPSWTSRCGSITFNPWGREFPFSGMNEKGLVICSLGLRKTEYPPAAGLPVIFMAQWVQYHLDTCTSVEAVIQSASGLSVCPPLDVTGGLHYFCCDASGVCAVIEFLSGKLVCRTGSGLSVPALTNSPYAECMAHLLNGTMPHYDNLRSIERFKTVAGMLHDFVTLPAGAPAVSYAFRILDAVRFGELTEEDGVLVRSLIATEWSVVYDITNRRFSFRTFEDKTIRTISLQAFDFSCSTPVKVLDIHRKLGGDVSEKCIDYTPDLNRLFLERASKIIPKISRDMTEGLKRIADYPEQGLCVGEKTLGK